MKQTITIGPGTDIDLPELVQSRLLIQGNSGAGKSGVARVIIEKSFGIIPFVVWDIEGEYYTLKELSGDIIIIGGQHADVPLTMELAEKLPAFIIKNGLNVVVDLSDLKMHARIEFTKDFFETLMDLPMDYWTSYFFFLEECHKLAGEQDKQESATAIKDLMQRGRKRGYCGIPITQRISMLNKSVAAECNSKFIGRTGLDLDMDRSAKELGFSKKTDRLKLRDLAKKHFYAYGTSISPQHVHEITIEDAKTTMPRQGMKLNFKPGKPTDKLLEMLAKLSEPTKEKTAGKNIPHSADQYEDVSPFIKRIAELEYDLIESERIQRAHAKDAASRGVLLTTIKNLIIDQEHDNQDFPEMDLSPIDELQRKRPLAIEDPRTRSNGIMKTEDVLQSQLLLSKSEKNLSGGEKITLIACAQYKEGLTRPQLTILTAYKQSARDSFISRLKQKNYLQQNGERLQATRDGIKALGRDYQPLPTGSKLRQHWLEKLTGGEKVIFEAVIKRYPRSISRQELEQITTYKQSARDSFISRLSIRQLLTLPEKGHVKASQFLFD